LWPPFETRRFAALLRVTAVKRKHPMPTAAPGAGPQIGHVVIYRQNATTAYPAIITQVNANGTVSLTTFPPGSSPGTQANVAHDYAEKKSGAWYFAPYL
jgi:hypothetical protein